MVAVLFRTLDVLRIFDLPAILTGGGGGTGTPPRRCRSWWSTDPAGLQQRRGAVDDHVPVHLLRRLHLRQVPAAPTCVRDPSSEAQEAQGDDDDVDRRRVGTPSGTHDHATAGTGTAPDDAEVRSAPTLEDRPDLRRRRRHRRLGPGARSTGWSSPRSATSATPSTPPRGRRTSRWTTSGRRSRTDRGNHFARALVNSLIIGVVHHGRRHDGRRLRRLRAGAAGVPRQVPRARASSSAPRCSRASRW